MHYNHDIELAREYALEAMERLRQEKLAPTPDNYELWYVYYSGQSPEVTRAIDILVTNKQKITEERCQELYQRFLSESRNDEHIRRAGDQIKDTIRNMSGAVKDVRSASAAYSGRLGDMTAQISSVRDPGELKSVLDTVIRDTGAMIEQNHRLEQELDRSSSLMLEMQRDLERVRRESLTDGLTGLANRKAFDGELKRIVAEAQAGGAPCTLLMMDIDHFKTFNDHYGHQVGDQVLRLVARTLTDGVKGRDVAARYGGEEFSIILPESGLQAGITVGNALRKAVASKDVVNRGSGEKLGRITMSVGVAEFSMDESVSELIERADAALYTAKHNGRNQVAAAPTPGRKQEKDTL